MTEFVDDLLEIGLEDATERLAEFNQTELADMLRRAEEYSSLITAAKRKIADALALIIDGPIVTEGAVYKLEAVCKRSKWDKARLVDALTEWCTRRLIDQESGEVVVALDPRKVAAVFEPATGRTKVLRETVGLELREFCEEQWVDEIVKVKL